MTKAEKIALLLDIIDGEIVHPIVRKEVGEWAIKALNEQNEDAISRQAALDEIISRLGISGEKYLLESERYIYQIIKDLPGITPMQRTGHWITKVKSDLRGDMWPTNPKCSECGGEPYYNNTIYNYKFCPNCGAKMESEEEA